MNKTGKILFILLAKSILFANDLIKIPKISNSEKNTAIVIVTFNRPDYLEQVIKSLETNPESQTLPFFFFLDGGPNSTQEKNIEVIENSTIKYKNIIKRECNYGCGRNIIDARRHIFDELNFKKAIIFEDDLIASPNYITLVLNLHKWAKQNYNNIAIVQGWNLCTFTYEEKQKKLNHVFESFAHLWGYCINKKTWEKIKNFLYNYENKFLMEIPYNKRNHQAIRNWIQEQINNTKQINNQSTQYKPHYFSKIDYKGYFLSNRCGTGQDAITMFAIYKAGLIKITTLVNRGINIGEIGINCNPKYFNKLGLDKVKLDIFEDDKFIKVFNPIER